MTGFTGMPVSAVEALAEIISAGVAPTTYAPADGSALDFIAPADVTFSGSAANFTGTNAVLIASAATQSYYTVRVTLTSLEGGVLAVSDLGDIVVGSSSGTTITLAGPLARTLVPPAVGRPSAGRASVCSSGNGRHGAKPPAPRRKRERIRARRTR